MGSGSVKYLCNTFIGKRNEMSINKLIELAGKYYFPDEIIEQREKDRLSFVEKFPLAMLKDLSIDQFVQGTDDNSFCYWLEFKKIGFGIGGGNASKFGIYKTKKREEIVYATGYGKNKTYLDDQTAKNYFSDLLTKLLKALEYTKNDQIDKIRVLEIPMWNMVLQKILGIYYPDKFLTIGSPDVLIKCVKILEIKNIEHSSDNSILINYECKRAISKNPPFSNWSYEKIGTFIWETFDGENIKKRKRKESEQYWLYAPGENASHWNEFYQGGIMGLGWDEIGDLSQYKSREDIKRALVNAYGGTGSKKNDVSANDDFLNKIKIGDVIIAKKGRGELLGYGVVTSDYIYDKNRKNYHKTREIDWKIKGNWSVDFNLALKTLTEITKYSSDDAKYDTYYEKLLGIMGVGQTQKDNRESFTIWLTKKYGENSGTSNSYIKAIDVLSQILSKELFKTTEDNYLESLYKDLIKEQHKKKGKYYYPDALAYGSDGIYSDSIKSYREFLKQIDNPLAKNIEMSSPLNTILYGPPGTGKTYHTVLRAAEIIENRKIPSYSEALSIFKANLHDQIEFITFHQNYSYEDFIQGLRPDTRDENEQLKFKKSDGVFKVIADRALINYKESEKAPEDISQVNAFSEALEVLKDKILDSEEPVRINDTAYFTAVEDDAFRYSGDNWTLNDKGFNGFRMKYSDLERFLEEDVKQRKEIKNLKNISGLAKQHATYFIKAYELVKSMMPKTTKKVEVKPRKNYVIIIDEINRANISRVFGELITLIEPDKRSHGAIPMEAKLPSGDPFVVPSNLFIIGTMNTADKSIALLDIALRRRFEFEAMYPKYEIEGQVIYDVDILKKINEQIIKSKGHDFQIGHAYFMGENKDLISRMNKKVIPLLLEYYMHDDKEVKSILQASGLAIEENSWPLRITGKND